MIIRRRHLNEVHADEIDAREPAQNGQGLVGREAAWHGRTGAGCEGRVETVDIESEIDGMVAEDARDFRPDLLEAHRMHLIGIENVHAIGALAMISGANAEL